MNRRELQEAAGRALMPDLARKVFGVLAGKVLNDDGVIPDDRGAPTIPGVARRLHVGERAVRNALGWLGGHDWLHRYKTANRSRVAGRLTVGRGDERFASRDRMCKNGCGRSLSGMRPQALFCSDRCRKSYERGKGGRYWLVPASEAGLTGLDAELVAIAEEVGGKVWIGVSGELGDVENQGPQSGPNWNGTRTDDGTEPGQATPEIGTNDPGLSAYERGQTRNETRTNASSERVEGDFVDSNYGLTSAGDATTAPGGLSSAKEREPDSAGNPYVECKFCHVRGGGELGVIQHAEGCWMGAMWKLYEAER